MNKDTQYKDLLTAFESFAKKKGPEARRVPKSSSHLDLTLYANRRLYVKGWGGFTTIQELIPHIRSGGTIKVRAQYTKVDVTEQVLRSILAAIAEKSEASSEALYEAIRSAKAVA